MSYAADIESIFNPCNLDEDCSYIAHLLSPYEKLIVARMDAGDYTCAVTVFLEILETLTRHFVADEHYTYFDDMYSPEYVCDGIMQAMTGHEPQDRARPVSDSGTSPSEGRSRAGEAVGSLLGLWGVADDALRICVHPCNPW